MTAFASIYSGAPALWFLNSLITINVSANQNGDGLCVVDHRLPYGDSPPLHIHRNEDEVFHILSGTVRFHVAGTDLLATEGQTVVAPKGIPHSYRVESQAGARFLTVTHGADFETMLRRMSRPAQTAELPPQSAPTPEAMEAVTRACAENGIDLIGPPLA